eukprot:2565410-Amphidinium_carterae.1
MERTCESDACTTTHVFPLFSEPSLLELSLLWKKQGPETTRCDCQCLCECEIKQSLAFWVLLCVLALGAVIGVVFATCSGLCKCRRHDIGSKREGNPRESSSGLNLEEIARRQTAAIIARRR